MAIRGTIFHISGRVQGVGFRYFTEQQARRLGVKGYVRNLPDGRVETAAAADPDRMEEFLRALHRGPPLSKVTAVQKAGEVDLGDVSGFQVTV